jgi:hypothetical protein
MTEFFRGNGLEHPDQDKQNQAYTEQLENLLADNNLVRKKLPEEKNSLLKAVSDTLYFTPHFHEEIQQDLIKHLKTLIASSKLSSKLTMFKGNSILLKDFTMSSQQPGFDKINLELVSSLFKVRVIIYGITEDNYLSGMIINSGYKKTIELLRTKNNHYDPIYSADHIARAGICQNIVLNIIDQALNFKTDNFKDFNRDNYVNYEYNNWIASKQASNGLEQFRITRGRHKKSFSDNFNKNHEAMEEQHMKIYNMFMNMKPPDDFLNKITGSLRKDTQESNFSIHADLDFVDENWQDTPPQKNQEYAIKNYPISSSSKILHKDLRTSSPQLQRNKPLHENNIFFGENLSLAEIEKLENGPSKGTSSIAPIYYPNNEPPGLAPTQFLHKSYNFSDTLTNSTSNMDISSPTFQNRENIQPLQLNYSHSLTEAQQPNGYAMNYQSNYSPQGQNYPNPYLKRAESDRGLQLQISANSSYLNHQQHMMTYGQNSQMQQNFLASREKKKPIVLDESTRRYSGRLKFFDETKNYGFIIMDEDGSDIFVHYDDLVKANLTKELLRTAKAGNIIKLSFSCMQYIGKYNRSRKAIDVQMVL